MIEAAPLLEKIQNVFATSWKRLEDCARDPVCQVQGSIATVDQIYGDFQVTVDLKSRAELRDNLERARHILDSNWDHPRVQRDWRLLWSDLYRTESLLEPGKAAGNEKVLSSLEQTLKKIKGYRKADPRVDAVFYKAKLDMAMTHFRRGVRAGIALGDEGKYRFIEDRYDVEEIARGQDILNEIVETGHLRWAPQALWTGIKLKILAMPDSVEVLPHAVDEMIALLRDYPGSAPAETLRTHALLSPLAQRLYQWSPEGETPNGQTIHPELRADHVLEKNGWEWFKVLVDGGVKTSLPRKAFSAVLGSAVALYVTRNSPVAAASWLGRVYTITKAVCTGFVLGVGIDSVGGSLGSLSRARRAEALDIGRVSEEQYHKDVDYFVSIATFFPAFWGASRTVQVVSNLSRVLGIASLIKSVPLANRLLSLGGGFLPYLGFRAGLTGVAYLYYTELRNELSPIEHPLSVRDWLIFSLTFSVPKILERVPGVSLILPIRPETAAMDRFIRDVWLVIFASTAMFSLDLNTISYSAYYWQYGAYRMLGRPR